MDTKTQTKKISLILIVLIVAAGAVWYVAFAYIKHTAEAASILEQELQEKQAIQKEDRSLREFLDKNEETQKLGTYIIESSQQGTVSFTETIESLARANALTIKTNNIEHNPDAPQPESHEYLKLNFTTDGLWKNTYAFISMIETLPYKIKINKVGLTFTGTTESVSADKKVSKTLNWKATYEIEVLKKK